jgi:hypothetical protein
MTDSRSHTIRTFIELHRREPDMRNAKDLAELWFFANANADRAKLASSAGYVHRKPGRPVARPKPQPEPVE